MTPLRHNRPPQRRALRVILTLIACAVALWFYSNARGESADGAGGLSTQALFTSPFGAEPAATPVATTAPVALPTSTAATEPTAVAEPTVAAEPTAAPGATATVVATPSPVVDDEADPSPASAPDPATTVTTAAAPAAAPAAITVAAPAAAPAAITVAAAVAAPVVPAATLPTPLGLAAPVVVVATPTATVAPQPEPTSVPRPTAAPAVPSAGQAVAYALGRINAVRSQAGLGPVVLDPALSAISLDWSQQMGTVGFTHRPGPQLTAMLPAGWSQWGENIVTITAPDIAAAQASLETSPGHYANMVGHFTHVGIGVFIANGQLWMTQNFVRY